MWKYCINGGDKVRVRGVAKSGLAGGSFHKVSGLGPFLGRGPFFYREVIREEYSLIEVLKRVAEALKSLQITEVQNLWIGEQAVFQGHEEAFGDLTLLVQRLGQRSSLKGSTNFYLTMCCESDGFSNILWVTFIRDHKPEDLPITVEVSGEVVKLQRQDDEDDESYYNRTIDLIPDESAARQFIAAQVEAMERFLDRILEALRKQLPLEGEERLAKEDPRGRPVELGLPFPETGQAGASLGPPV